MSVVLIDGEVLHGMVEWYDRDCIKLTRYGSPNLLIYKQVIKYVYKDGEEACQGRRTIGVSRGVCGQLGPDARFSSPEA